MSAAVEDRFGFAEMQIVSLPDLYAGKMAAALDRQHPRDLFDIHHLLENEGIDEDLFRAFLIYLASHPRPVHELLCPHKLDIAAQYDEEFVGMTVTPLPLGTLLTARDALIEAVQRRAAEPAARRFLESFVATEPDWSVLGLGEAIAELPALRWKLMNLERLRQQNPHKFAAQAEQLNQCLNHAI